MSRGIKTEKKTHQKLYNFDHISTILIPPKKGKKQKLSSFYDFICNLIHFTINSNSDYR